MKLRWCDLKSNKIIVLPLYIVYIVFFEVLLGFGAGDIWDRIPPPPPGKTYFLRIP